MPYQAASFPIGGRDAYVGLLWKYSIMAVYSAGAVVFGATTVGKAVDEFYARMFPAMLFLCCCGALIGVVRSRWTRKVWIEYAGTLGLLAGLVGYSIAIVYAGVVVDGDLSRIPPGVLPIALCIFPFLRLRNIIQHVRRDKAAQLAAAEAAEARSTGVDQ
jgi:hypothetical protein